MRKTITCILSLCMLPFIAQSQAVLTAIFDGDLPGGLPKGAEIYILEDISDLSRMGIGSANNGGGTNGIEYTFPAIAVDSGTYVYIASDSAGFATFFGFNPDFVSAGAMAINGDDAVELFWDGEVIDVFGEIDVDGTGQPWEYMDGWAARKAFTGPDGSNFILQNWRFSGINALDGQTSNETALIPIPIRSYTDTTGGGPDVVVIAQNLLFTPRDITIEVGQTVRWTNVEAFEQHNVNGQQALFPCNPVGFYSGLPAFGPWDYDLTFNVPGFYEYVCDPHATHGMQGSVTVIDPNAPQYALLGIADVHDEDMDGNALSAGVTCELRGVVHGPNLRPAGLQFVIIDVDAGAGITVFKTGADCYNVTEGDLISVKGTITQFSGLTEIVPEQQIEVLSTGNALMQPIETDQPIDESHESLMVRVLNITSDSIVATGTSGWNLYGRNPLGTDYLVRLDADVFSDVSAYAGATMHVTGLGSQFDPMPPYDEGYQIFPRSASDIQVTVSVTTLPRDAVSVRPNPVQDELILDTSLQVTTVRIYTVDGRQVRQVIIQNNRIDVAALHPGIYLLQAETSGGVWSSMFVKE